jgi:hypothetical protein
MSEIKINQLSSILKQYVDHKELSLEKTEIDNFNQSIFPKYNFKYKVDNKYLKHSDLTEVKDDATIDLCCNSDVEACHLLMKLIEVYHA